MIGYEDASAAARREAGEELGISLHTLEFVPVYGLAQASRRNGKVCSSHRMLPLTATDGRWSRAEHEDITVVERPLDSLAADAMQGEVADGKLLT